MEQQSKESSLLCIKRKEEYTKVRINGLVAMISNADFDKYYEIVGV